MAASCCWPETDGTLYPQSLKTGRISCISFFGKLFEQRGVEGLTSFDMGGSAGFLSTAQEGDGSAWRHHEGGEWAFPPHAGGERLDVSARAPDRNKEALPPAAGHPSGARHRPEGADASHNGKTFGAQAILLSGTGHQFLHP
jgi:hypothetical protein